MVICEDMDVRVQYVTVRLVTEHYGVQYLVQQVALHLVTLVSTSTVRYVQSYASQTTFDVLRQCDHSSIGRLVV